MEETAVEKQWILFEQNCAFMFGFFTKMFIFAIKQGNEYVYFQLISGINMN